MADPTPDSRYFTRPDGKVVNVRQVGWQSALKRGYRLSTPEEMRQIDYADQEGRAAVEGAARGLTGGFSDPFVKGLYGGEESVSGLKGRREANPAISGAADVGGTVVGAALLPEGRAASVATGSLYGLGSSVSDEALGDPNTLAEKLVAMAAGGLAVGALDKVGSKIAGAADSLLLRAKGGAALSDQLSELADKALAKQLRVTGSDLNKYGLRERLPEVLDYAREKGLVHFGQTNEGLAEKAGAHAKGLGDQLGQVLQTADEKGAYDIAPLADKAQGLLEELGNDPNKQASYNKLKDWLEHFKTEPVAGTSREDVLASLLEKDKNGMLSKLNPKYQQQFVDQELERMGLPKEGGPAGQSAGYEKITYSDAWKYQKGLRDIVGPMEPSKIKEDLFKFRGILRDDIIEQASKISPYHGQELSRLSDEYGKAKQIATLAQKASEQPSGDLGAGVVGAVLGGPHAIAGAAAGAIGNHVLKTRGGFIADAVLSKLADSKAVATLSRSFKRTMDKMLERPSILGKFYPILAQASARGATALLATHISLAKTDPEYLKRLGLEPETPQATGEYAGKLAGFGSLQELAGQHDQQVELSIRRLTGSAPGRAPDGEEKEYGPEHYAQCMQDIQNTLSGANGDLGAISGVSPNVAAAMQVQAGNNAQFLLAKAPKSPFSPEIEALREPWQPSKVELEKFYRYVKAVEQPQQILEDLRRDGRVTLEAAEAMRNVYPRMLDEMKQKLMDHLQEWKQPMPYKQKQALAELFGDDILGNPQEMTLIQNLHASNMQAKGQGQGAQKPPDGRQKVDQQENLETQAQRLEGRS